MGLFRTFAASVALLISLAGCASVEPNGRAGRLAVSADGRSLVREDGRPFFWLADTAWELLHRASRDEAELYLEDRRRKGFTVVQTVILAELAGLRVANANGDLPLLGEDPARPNEAYFRHVDDVLAIAERKGLYLALLPTWGDKFNKKWGEGPEVFMPANARTYGEFLGRRYGGRRVIWIMGGDRNPENAQHFAIVRAMAEGIRAATGGRQLMTYHPQGGTKSWDFFREDSWIDFHMFQSGHGEPDLANYRFTLEGRALQPVKPVLDGEPRYEDHPINWKPELGWFGDFDVRQAAWWSMLSGAAGHTYGSHDIWQMWQPGRDPVSAARTPWKVALGHPGAAQMGHMRRFLEAHGFGQLEPAQELLAEEGAGARHQRAARSRDGRTAIVYTPYGDPIRLRDASGGTVRWFDPRTGAERPAAAAAGAFDPPGQAARGNDWVLVMERRG